MRAETWRRAQGVFEAALAFDATNRGAFLRRACAGDHELRSAVDRLLAHDRSGFLSEPLLRPAGFPDKPPLAGWIGRRVGSYRLTSVVGEGGMGTVFRAERCEGDVEHQVAIKIIRERSPRHRFRRFDTERRVLARLHHPYIARFLGAGATDEGLPYFIMEHVEGLPITGFCDRCDLDLAARIRLFQRVCAAVQYAHQHLVVHRDIKPSNVLVTSDGQPKLLDFGIAKLLDDSLSAESTGTDDRLLTPAYASPEQVAGEDVTTRTDVYLLGTLLYEMLTGRRPYGDGADPAVRGRSLLRGDEPPAPSSVLQPGPGAERRRRRLRGDLDTILLRALQRDAGGRYPSVEQLSEDLGRHLSGRPVLARPVGLPYRLAKLLRRHRLAATMAAAATVLAIALGGMVLVHAVRVEEERDAAVREKSRADRVTQFLVDAFEPHHAQGGSVTAIEVVDRGTERLRREIIDDLELRRRLLGAMARIYFNLGFYEASAGLLEEQLAAEESLFGGETPEVAETSTLLGFVLSQAGDYRRAEGWQRRALALRQRLFGEDDPRVAESLGTLAWALRERGDARAAERLLRQAVAIARGSESLIQARLVNNLGMVLRDKGDLGEAEAFLRETLRLKRRLLADDHPSVAVATKNLGLVLVERGDYAAAEPLLLEGLELYRNLYGEDHPDTAIALHNVGILRRGSGRLDEAETLLRRALDVHRRSLGEEHAWVARDLSVLGQVLWYRGDHGRAEASLRQGMAILRGSPGGGGWHLGVVLYRLADVLASTGRLAEARQLAEESERLTAAAYSGDHWRAAFARGVLGSILAREGRFDEAETRLASSYATLRRSRGERSEETALAAWRLAELYTAWGRGERAQPFRLAARAGPSPPPPPEALPLP